MTDLAVPVGAGGAVLKPVERALAGQRRAGRPPRLELAGQDRHHRVVPQPVVVDQVLVPQGDPDHPLADHCRDSMLDPRRVPAVREAGREPLDQADRAVGRAEQQRAGIRGHRPAVECRHHRATLDRSKSERSRATLCRHRGAPLLSAKSFSQKNYRPFRAPMHLPLVRNAG